MREKKNLKTIPSSEAPTIAEYREEYAKADKFCREVQDFNLEAAIPAMTELRNAGHHFLVALNDDGELKKPKELTRGINHCKRACYEAGEAGIVYILGEIRSFQNNFIQVSITEIIPDYIELLAECEKAREMVVNNNRINDEDKTNDYQLRMDAYNTVKDIYRKLDAAKEELVKSIESKRSSSRRFIISTLIALLGIIVATGTTIYVAQ